MFDMHYTPNQEECVELNYTSPSSIAQEEIKAAPIPSSYDTKSLVNEVKKNFSDGFQWADLGKIILFFFQEVDQIDNLSLDKKREIITEMLYILIDETDTPYLPDAFTDPIFKSIVPPFVDLLTDPGKLAPQTTYSQHPTKEEVESYAHILHATFEDGFQWSDLFTLCQLSIRFSWRYTSLNNQEKEAIANYIIDYIIDNTDTPYLPDTFSDPIFKDISHSLIKGVYTNS